MIKNTVTRADLAEALYREIGLSRTESASLVEAVIDQVIDSLIRGDDVKLAGFGTFSLRDKKERIGRNPKTGTTVALAGKHVPHFKPGKELRERVNNGFLKEQQEKAAE